MQNMNELVQVVGRIAEWSKGCDIEILQDLGILRLKGEKTEKN